MKSIWVFVNLPHDLLANTQISAPWLVEADEITRATKTDSNPRLRPNTMQML